MERIHTTEGTTRDQLEEETFQVQSHDHLANAGWNHRDAHHYRSHQHEGSDHSQPRKECSHSSTPHATARHKAKRSVDHGSLTPTHEVKTRIQ